MNTGTSNNAAKPGGMMANIACNVALPAIIMSKFSEPERLGPVWALVLGLAFPLGYGLWDFARERKANFLSILGFVSILLTGSFGLMQLDGLWFAIKEASIPALIGLVTVGSLRTRSPLVRTLLFNDSVIDVAMVESELDRRSNTNAFNQLLVRTTWLLAGSFLLSAILNFALAAYTLKSPAGTPEFNQELGRMTALSYPVIVVPSMAVTMFALWVLIRGIKQLTGLSVEAIFRNHPAPAAAATSDKNSPQS